MEFSRVASQQDARCAMRIADSSFSVSVIVALPVLPFFRWVRFG